MELLRGFFGIEAPRCSRRVTEKVISRLLGADPGLEAALPAFLALLDVPVEDPGWQALDPPQRRRRTLDIARSACGSARPRSAPSASYLENLHRIDAETQAFLDSFVESLSSHRVLLVVTYRPEYRHPWTSRSYYAQITLNPLSLESAHRLARSLVGDDDTLRPAHHLIVERAAGNPLFLQKALRDTRGTGVLVGIAGPTA